MQVNSDFFENKHRPYYILAPAYSRQSTGVRVLHLLCHYLNKLGEEAYVLSTQTNPSLRTPLLTQDIVNQHKLSNRSPIAIYPEVLHGNIFGASSVVRYILNHPGLLGGPVDFDKNDMMVFWHEDYVDFSKYADPKYIFIPSIDTTLFNNKNNPHDGFREKKLIFPGRYKQAQQELPELFKDATVITYDWPSSHEDLAALLRRAKVLYTFANSAIISEALLCGCPVVIIETIFTKKPEERAGIAKGTALPGTTYEDSPEAIERAREKLLEYQQSYHQHALELVSQLQNFVVESQSLPRGNVDDIIFPVFQTAATDLVCPEQKAYENWREIHKLKPCQAAIHAERMVKAWHGQPQFLIVMPLTADRMGEAVKSLSSIALQMYKQWQLIFVADFDPPSEELLQSEVLGWLRIDDVDDVAQLTQSYTALRDALSFDWMVIFPPGTELESNAFLSIGDYAFSHPEWQAIYCDSDEVDNRGSYKNPAFKPDFSIDFLRGYNYIGQSVWFRREALLQTNGMSNCPGADGYDALLKIHDGVGGKSIGHISNVLVHLPEKILDGEKNVIGMKRALQEHFSRLQINAEVVSAKLPSTHEITYLNNKSPSISIVVADAQDNISLSPCIDAILENSIDGNLEIIAVSNTESLLPSAVNKVRCDVDHTLQNRFQLGAEVATGDYLLFLDSRIELIQKNTLTRLLGLASRVDVGAVAMRLLQPDHEHIWQGPYLLGLNIGEAAIFQGERIETAGYLNMLQVENNPGAVSIEGLMIGRELYEKIGGINSMLPSVEAVSIDLCYRISDAGQLIVWTPFVSALRHEFSSIKRLEFNVSDMLVIDSALHAEKRIDPFHNRNLRLNQNSPFEVDDVFSPEWDTSFHDRPRVLILGSDSCSEADDMQNSMMHLEDDGVIQLSCIKYEHRLPTWAELERISPDIILMSDRFDNETLDFQFRLRSLRPDILSILVLSRLGNMLNKRYDSAQLKARLLSMSRVVVSCEGIREALRDFPHEIVVIDRALNEDKWTRLDNIQRSGTKIRVGWVGSENEVDDFDLIKECVAGIAGDVEWIVLGYCPDHLREYVSEYYQFDLSRDDFSRKLASLSLDLGVIPKANVDVCDSNVFMRVLEYGALGISVICSAGLSSVLEKLPVAFSANTGEEWVSKILRRAHNREVIEHEADELRQSVHNNHLLLNRLPLWRAVMDL
ncbi:glycosyltransferase family 2 protein [Chromobacterium amazonense]|uniref:glycosyltransferase family 2 protein n=1 Tax=Chromobacterium amazonense TaxID=1382803 RepID=UPI000A5E9E8E|nr:hypothetical protein [Chromobacterium amazonense]